MDALLVLLDRLEDDNMDGWQVLISCFVVINRRYDEWIIFDNAESARQFIFDFSPTAVSQFLARGQVWLTSDEQIKMK